MSLIEIMTFENAGSASFVESALQAESIFYHLSRDHFSSRPRLLVHKDELEKARNLLIELGFEERVYSKSRLGLQ